MKNVPIRIISPNFELLGEIDDYESLQFIRRFYKVGEFELHINANKVNTDILIENNLVLLGSHFNKVGIIMHRENEIDENGETTDTLIIKGPTLKGIMSRRLIVPPTNGNGYESHSGAVETILKNFVNNNVVSPADIDRKMPQMVIVTDQGRGKQDSWRSRFEVLSDKLAEIGEYAQMGWNVTLDIENSQWVFDVFEGRNMTVNQDTLPPVIFSTDFDNIKNQHFVQSSIGTSNVGYAGGKGDEADRLIQKIGNTAGFERIESFLDCSNADNTTELLTMGQQKLNELKRILTFEFQLIPDNTFKYEQDYDLGDFVTAQSKKWGITMDCQIVELTEVYEAGGTSLEATFGTSIPTIIDKIKNIDKTSKLVEPKAGGTGDPGVSLQYSWNGTQLGVRLEGDSTYQYVNLKGDTGAQGPKGEKGDKGDPGTTEWEGINNKPSTFPPSEHTHVKSDISDFPSTLPANGGNSDTVDNKHASDFLLMSAYLAETKPSTNIIRSNLGNPSILEAGMIDGEINNKLWFYNASKINFEISDDDITYTPFEVSDIVKKKLVSGNNNANITFAKGKYLRITIDPVGYVYLNYIYMYFSSQGNNIKVKCEKKRDDEESWITVFDYNNSASGWPAHMLIPHTAILFSSASIARHYNHVRITIQATAQTNDYPNMILSGLEWYGGYPAGKRTIYSWDEDKNVTFPAEVKAPSFKKTDGTEVAYVGDIPTKLSQFENDIGAGGGLNIAASPTEPTEPTLKTGDWWYKEL